MSHDFINDCLNHMASNNLLLEGTLQVDGKIHRYCANGGSARDEWYIAHEGVTYRGNPILVCTYGSWSEGVKYTYKSFDEGIMLDQDEKIHLRMVLKEKREQAEAILQEQYQEVADEACALWQRSELEPPSPEYEVYTIKKQVPAYSTRWCDYKGIYPSMVIPLYDIDNNLRSLQFIWFNEREARIYKSFLTGGQKRGNFYMMGTPQEAMPLVVVEGYATGATIYKTMSCKWPTVVAFDAGNLSPVIENLKLKYPNSEIIIAADNDTTGRNKAYEASAKFNCKVCVPEFTPENDEFTDFNDLMVWQGADKVKEQLIRSLSMRGWTRKK